MQQINNRRRAELLFQMYLTTKDIGEWFGKGQTWARLKMKELQRQAIIDGKKTLRGVISTKSFMRYEGIDRQEIIALAKNEKEIFGE